MSSFPTDEAHLASLFSESVLYGLFIATFIGLLRAVLLRGATFRAAAPVRWSLLAVACAMFVVASVDIALNLLHDLNAFIYYQGPGGPIGEFSKISHWIQITRVSTTYSAGTRGIAMLIHQTQALLVRFTSSHWRRHARTPNFFNFNSYHNSSVVRRSIAHLLSMDTTTGSLPFLCFSGLVLASAASRFQSSRQTSRMPRLGSLSTA